MSGASRSRPSCFRPVVFREEDERFIPVELRRFNRYRVDTPEDYERLLRWLYEAPSIVASTIGPKPNLPPEGQGAPGRTGRTAGRMKTIALIEPDRRSRAKFSESWFRRATAQTCPQQCYRLVAALQESLAQKKPRKRGADDRVGEGDRRPARAFATSDYPATQLARHLEKEGLPQNFVDLRLFCCSAGLGTTHNGNPVAPYAQRLKAALTALGYNSIIVTGYSGDLCCQYGAYFAPGTLVALGSAKQGTGKGVKLPGDT